MTPRIQRPITVRAAIAVALATLAMATLAAASAQPATKSGGGHSVYWGAQIGEQLTGEAAPWDMTAVSKLQRKVGKGLSLIAFNSPFAQCGGSGCTFYRFPTTPLDNIRNYGAIPFFSWSSASSPISHEQPNFQLSDVIQGKYDSFITEFATSAKAWGHPFFIRFNWEMNGDWYPWSERRNGNSSGQYVSAWRHVHNIFSGVGANNVSWVWCPNVILRGAKGVKGARFQRLGSLYPGGAYVDWACIDGFNWGNHPVNPAPWRTFSEVFKKTYRKVVKVTRGKPIIIGETASTDRGGSKARWIRDTLRKVRGGYRKIRGFIWFDVIDRGVKWPIESSHSSIRAFRKGIRSRAFKPNNFGNISASPIPPP